MKLIRIAICDDNDKQIALLRRMLGEWSGDKPFALVIDEYISAESFLFSYPDKPCNLLLLDIEMKNMSGIDLAKKLRAKGDMIPIIFITGYSDYMGDGYEVEALHYLLKPVNQDKLFEVLDRYIRRHNPGNDIVLKCEDKTLHISPEMIEYCEAVGKKSHVHLSDGTPLICETGIGGLKNILNDEFIFCHRSYIVNLRFVRSIGKNEINLDSGGIIPLSRRLYKEVNDKFIGFYTKNEV